MKKIVKNVVWLLMLLAASATAQAQPAKGNAPYAQKGKTTLAEIDKLLGKEMVIDPSTMKSFRFSTDDITDPHEREMLRDRMRANRPAKQNKALKEGEPLYTVKCVFKGEDMPYFAIYNPDFFLESRMGVWFEQEETDTYYFRVPAGTYDVFTQYYSRVEGMRGWGNIVHEDIVVDGDMEVEFSAEELTEKVVIKPMLRDGREAVLPTYIELDEEPWYELDYTNATAEFSYLNYLLFREDCENVVNGYAVADCMTSGWNEETVFLSNKLSDKYHYVFEYFLCDDKGEFQISTTDMVGSESGVVESYNKDYVRFDVPNFSETPLYKEFGVEKFHTAISGLIWYDDVQRGGGGMYTEKTEPVVYWTCQLFADNVNIKSPIAVTNVQAEKTVTYEEDGHEFSEVQRAEMIDIPALYNGYQWEYINQNHSQYGNFSYQSPADGGPIVEYPGVPAYCYFADGITQPIGNSSPILSVMNQVKTYGDNTLFLFNPDAYIGRYGEVRNCDWWKRQIEVKLDGKKVFDNSDGGYLVDWCVENSTDGHEKGIIEATFIDTNVLVDETITGYNHTTITVDERNEDLCTPTPQMLIFKNTAGAITDRFDKAGDGVIEFSAGDFNWFDNGDRHGYTCEEADVLVEYAPYGEDSFEPIEVEEIPENYYMPGFGYFYRGSLRDVAQKSSNGWFDVRFTLTDKAGNRMVQRVSPAFRIDANVGVAAVEANGLRIKSDEGRVTVSGEGIKAIELYSADGRLVGVASGNELDASGYRGLGIVKVTDTKGATTTAKVIVR